MLVLALVLFVAQSAVCAPAVLLTEQNINEIAPPRQNNAQLVSSGLVEGALELVDGGEQSVYVLNAVQALDALADRGDVAGKVIVVGQVLNLLDAEAVGNSGDACAYANLINSYVSYVNTGNSGPLQRALREYANRLIASVGNIVRLAVDPSHAYYATGPIGNCAGAGRTYQFEAAWDAILRGTSATDMGPVNEQYCNAQRLYNAIHVRNNIVGAGITAAAVPQAVQLLAEVVVPAASFLRAIAVGSDPSALGAELQVAIAQAVGAVNV